LLIVSLLIVHSIYFRYLCGQEVRQFIHKFVSIVKKTILNHFWFYSLARTGMYNIIFESSGLVFFFWSYSINIQNWKFHCKQTMRVLQGTFRVRLTCFFLLGIRPETSRSTSRGRFHQCSSYSFYARRSKKQRKIQLSHQYLFTPSGSMSVKAVRKTLMKLTPSQQLGQQPQKYVLLNLVQPGSISPTFY